jgi:hypothetical protein
MITSYSRAAKSFEEECSRFIAAEGFNRFIEVAVGFTEAAEVDKTWNAGLRLSLHRLSRALGNLVKEEERQEREKTT